MNGLRFIREQSGISGAALARKLTVSQPTLFEWENGKRNIPLKQEEKLAQIFNLPVEYFGEILEDQAQTVSALIMANHQQEIQNAEEQEWKQANKDLKDAMRRISKSAKLKANSFDTFQDYISEIQSNASLCNLFADALEKRKEQYK